jgi:hypothetical protein
MRWRDTDWLAEAAAWIGERAEPTGELEQTHVEAWSTVLRVPTADGTLWFKAVAPDHAFEPQLTALLGRLLPDRVPELVAVDLDQAWMLMRDGGERLRELPASVEHWERVLPRYAELQLAATPHADELLALGVPDERLEGLRSRLEDALSVKPKGLSTRAYRQMLERLPAVEAIAEQVTAHGIAETLQHDDLHDGQVYVSDGRYRIFDWGDSCVSHPFHTLTVTLRAAAWKLGLEPGGPELRRIRDAYLEPFGPPSELAPIADVAYRTGTLARALAWHRYLAARETRDPEDEEAVAYGVQLFLDGKPIGAWE